MFEVEPAPVESEPTRTTPSPWFGRAAIPAASIPAGLGGGLPVGVQLMAAHGQDARIYRVGAALEAALGG